MRNNLFVFFTICLFISFAGVAQNNEDNSFKSFYVNHYENQIPPTPNAASFLQYGNMPINISRGLPSISIPIYTLVVDGLEIPISLSYDASGVKVDDISSTIGMKWTLNAGGGIFRTVNDEDDFGGSFGWINSTSQTHFEDWWHQLSSPDESWFGIKANQDIIRQHVQSFDQFPDAFQYNFLGYSGEFKFSTNGGIVKGINDNVSIEPHNIYQPNMRNTYFTAEDQSGNSFIFSNNQNNKDFNYTLSRTALYYDGGITDLVDSGNHVVGWLLDNIDTKNGDQIAIEYENTRNGPPDTYLFPYLIEPISEQLQLVRGCGECFQGIPWDCISNEDTSMFKHYYHTGTYMKYNPSTSLVKKITSENVDIEFLYLENNILESGVTTVIDGWKKRISTILITDKIKMKSKKFHFTYGVFAGNKRLKLTKIQEEGFEGEFKPPYRFTYNEEKNLPALGSRSKDIMGYYNGKSNASLIPKTKSTLNLLSGTFNRKSDRYYKILGDRNFDIDFLATGVLTEIEYPTGGKTVFDYEANAMGDNTREPQIKRKSNIIDNNRDFEVPNPTPPYQFYPFSKYIYSRLIEINNFVGQFQFTMLADCPDCYGQNGQSNLENPRIHIYKYNGSINDDPDDYFLPGKIGDGTGGDAVLEYPLVPNGDYDLTDSFDESRGNGVYIVMLLLGGSEFNSNYNPDTSDVRVSYSWHEEESDSNGDIVYLPNYFGGLRIKKSADVDVDNNVYNQKEYIYKQYYQHETAGFKSENYTKSYGNGDGPFFIYSEIVDSNPFVPLVRGYHYTDVETKFLGAGDPYIVKEQFKENRIFNSINDGLAIQKSIFNGFGNLLEYTELLYHNESTMAALDFLSPSEKIYPFTYQVLCSMSQGVNKVESGFSDRRIRNMFYTRNNLLSTNRSTQFFKSGTVYSPVTTIRSYNYNANLFISKENTDTRYTAQFNGNESVNYVLKHTNGEVIDTEYKYIDDPSVIPALGSLPVSLPISKEVFNDRKKILGQYFEYDNSGNIKNTYRYNKGEGSHNGGASYVPQNYELDFSFLTEYGRPTQVLGHKGLPTSYIWGYNLQYPVAKIVNLYYGAIPSATISNIQNLSTAHPYNEQALIAAFDALRVDYPQAEVTTYTYEPLIGISTITDPKGYQMNYKYDGLGRLKYVKDMEGKVLSENQYRYKNN